MIIVKSNNMKGLFKAYIKLNLYLERFSKAPVTSRKTGVTAVTCNP